MAGDGVGQRRDHRGVARLAHRALEFAQHEAIAADRHQARRRRGDARRCRSRGRPGRLAGVGQALGVGPSDAADCSARHRAGRRAWAPSGPRSASVRPECAPLRRSAPRWPSRGGTITSTSGQRVRAGRPRPRREPELRFRRRPSGRPAGSGGASSSGSPSRRSGMRHSASTHLRSGC